MTNDLNLLSIIKLTIINIGTEYSSVLKVYEFFNLMHITKVHQEELADWTELLFVIPGLPIELPHLNHILRMSELVWMDPLVMEIGRKYLTMEVSDNGSIWQWLLLHYQMNAWRDYSSVFNNWSYLIQCLVIYFVRVNYFSFSCVSHLGHLIVSITSLTL